MKRGIALILALMMLWGLCPAGQAEESEITYRGVVTGGSLHLRKEPSPSGKVVDTYKAGTEVDVLEMDGAWCRVQVGKKTGYMMTQYLEIKPNYPHLGWGKTPQDGTVLNVRAAADDGAAVVYKAMSGGRFELVEEKDGWYRVRVGDGFGYLPAAGVTLIDGDFQPELSAPADSVSLTPETLKAGPREVGSPTTISVSEGDFTYSITYPGLDFPRADGEISAWAQNTLAMFQQDRRQNHAGQNASYTVEYQSVHLDDRYDSVLLLGRYQVGALHADTALALNLDRETGRILNPETDLITEQTTRALFCLEAAAASLLSAPAAGYDGMADKSWLRYAVLGREGIQLLLPAGLYLPAVLGTQRLEVGYGQIAECMALDSQAIAAHRRVIDPGKPMIALTFDDGPSEETDRILAALTTAGGRATFCVIGNKVEAYSDVVKRTIAQGSEIACHTWSHPYLTKISVSSIRSQIQRVQTAVGQIAPGYEIKVLRPPYGSVNKNVRSVCGEMGMVIALWQVDTEDWNHRNATKTYNAILKGAKNGVIVLCHDIYKTTATAVERVIPELVARGYQLVTVSELLSFHKDGPVAGTTYTRLDPENIVTK